MFLAPLEAQSYLGSGLGRATALAFARAGAAGVHLVDINAENAKKASHEVANAASNPKFKSFASQLDLTNEDQVAKMLKATLEEFGRVDYAANIAGVRALVLICLPSL